MPRRLREWYMQGENEVVPRPRSQVPVKRSSVCIAYSAASLAGRARESDHMRAICQCDVRGVWDYNFDQSAKSPVRVVWEERPQAQRIDWISPTSLWLHLLSTLSFLTLSLAASHPNLYSSIPLLIHPFHLFFLPHMLSCSFSPKIITLHIQGTSISSEHALSSPSSPLLLFLSFQELAKAMLFQIIQLLKLILS